MTKRLLAFAALLALPSSGHSADVQQLVQETQRMTQTPTTLNMVWWMPTAFWAESLKQSPLTPLQQEEFLSVLDSYTIISVVHSDIGMFGGFTSKPRDEMVRNARFSVNGQTIEQLGLDELSPDAQNFIAAMKPMMSQMLGQFGQGMEFLVYPNEQNGAKFVDPAEAGNLEYTFFGNTYHWRLPLGSVLPPRFDSDTGESFPGNYKFSPYTGRPLVDTLDQSEAAAE